MFLVNVIIRSMDHLTLTEALLAVSFQTYSNVKVIIVNAQGGKHRELGNSCGRYPLRLINDCGEPLARSAAANFGLDDARGDFLLFLDDDDLILPKHIAQLVAELEVHSELVAAYSGVECINERGESLQEHFGKHYSKIRLISGNFIPIHSVLFKAQVRDSGCRFDEALDLFEDWDFWLQAAEIGQFLYIPSVTALYRISSSGGFGVKSSNADQAGNATQTLVTKWQRKWGSDSLYALMELGRYYHMAMDILQDNTGDTSSESLIESIQVLIKTNRDLKQKLESTNTQLNNVLNSRSWRLMGPLRYLNHVRRKRFTPPKYPS